MACAGVPSLAAPKLFSKGLSASDKLPKKASCPCVSTSCACMAVLQASAGAWAHPPQQHGTIIEGARMARAHAIDSPLLQNPLSASNPAAHLLVWLWQLAQAVPVQRPHGAGLNRASWQCCCSFARSASVRLHLTLPLEFNGSCELKRNELHARQPRNGKLQTCCAVRAQCVAGGHLVCAGGARCLVVSQKIHGWRASVNNQRQFQRY